MDSTSLSSTQFNALDEATGSGISESRIQVAFTLTMSVIWKPISFSPTKWS